MNKRAIRNYATKLLKYYRIKRKSLTPAMARFSARVKANSETTGNTYLEVAYRQLERYPRL